jgi:hypothetical protein
VHARLSRAALPARRSRRGFTTTRQWHSETSEWRRGCRPKVLALSARTWECRGRIAHCHFESPGPGAAGRQKRSTCGFGCHAYARVSMFGSQRRHGCASAAMAPGRLVSWERSRSRTLGLRRGPPVETTVSRRVRDLSSYSGLNGKGISSRLTAAGLVWYIIGRTCELSFRLPMWLLVDVRREEAV